MLNFNPEAEFEQFPRESEGILESSEVGGEESETEQSQKREREEAFDQYSKNLGLTEKFLKDKSILDIGGGKGEFASYVREKGISGNIFTIEPRAHSEAEEGDQRRGMGIAEHLPIKDESVDLVVSHASVPNIFIGEQDQAMQSEKIRQALNEAFRVVKEGGEVRFGPITDGKRDEFLQEFRNVIDKEIKEFQDENPNADVTIQPLYVHQERKYTLDDKGQPTPTDEFHPEEVMSVIIIRKVSSRAVF